MNRWKVALMLMIICGTGLALGQSFPTACDVVRLKDGFRLHGQIIGIKGRRGDVAGVAYLRGTRTGYCFSSS
jgi:hypothetical protein